MIRYVSALIVSMLLISPVLASHILATINNESFDFVNVVRNDGSSVFVAPKQILFGVPFRTRTTVTAQVNGVSRCTWDIRSSMVETLDSLIYNPENVLHGFSPCARSTK